MSYENMMLIAVVVSIFLTFRRGKMALTLWVGHFLVNAGLTLVVICLIALLSGLRSEIYDIQIVYPIVVAGTGWGLCALHRKLESEA